MPVGGEFSVLRQAFERLPLPDCQVVFDCLDCRRLEDEEAAVDPTAVAIRLLEKAFNAVVNDLESAEPARWLIAVTVAFRPLL